LRGCKASEGKIMESTSSHTIIKMMEMLPESTQDRVVDLVREYLADLEDETE